MELKKFGSGLGLRVDTCWPYIAWILQTVKSWRAVEPWIKTFCLHMGITFEYCVALCAILAVRWIRPIK